MIATKDMASILETWAAAVLSINTSDHEVSAIRELFPYVICNIERKRRATNDTSLEELGRYQQNLLHVFEARLLLMVDPEPVDTASDALSDYVDALGESVLADPTLGGRVSRASKFFDATFTPPEIEYQDGTIARAATFLITVGEVTEV